MAGNVRNTSQKINNERNNDMTVNHKNHRAAKQKVIKIRKPNSSA